MLKKFFTFGFIAALVLPVVFLFITYGTFQFHAPEYRSDAFDSLGRNILELEADVDPETITWEGFDINGKKYMYFGPFPSFLRIILNKISPEFYGQQARVSCFIAIILILITSFFTFNFALKQNNSIKRGKNLLLLLATTSLILGTPIFFLICCCRIFHESMLWGVAWSVVGISAYFLIIQKKLNSFTLFLLGISASFACLSRTTFALPLYFLSGVVFIRLFFEKRNLLLNIFSLSFSASIGAIIQMWYNYKRFGGIFNLFDSSLFYAQVGKDTGMFNLKRLLEGLYFYLIPNFDNFTTSFPFILARYPDLKHAELFIEWKEPFIAVTLSSSFLIILFLFFIFTLKNSKKNEIKKIDKIFYLNWLPLIIICTVQVIIISMYFFLTQRYIAEFVPLIFCLTLYLFLYVKNKKMLFCYALLTIISILITILGSISNFAPYISDLTTSWRNNFFKITAPNIPRLQEEGMARKFLIDQTPITEKYSSNKMRFEIDPTGVLKETMVTNAKHFLLLLADSEITYNVPQNAKYFEGILATTFQARVCEKTSVSFQVFDETGKSLSKKIVFGPKKKYIRHVEKITKDWPDKQDDYPYYLLIPLKDSKKITIKVLNYNGNFECDQFSIVDGAFLIKNENY